MQGPKPCALPLGDAPKPWIAESTTSRTAFGLAFTAKGGKRQGHAVPRSLRVKPGTKHPVWKTQSGTLHNKTNAHLNHSNTDPFGTGLKDWVSQKQLYFLEFRITAQCMFGRFCRIAIFE